MHACNMMCETARLNCDLLVLSISVLFFSSVWRDQFFGNRSVHSMTVLSGFHIGISYAFLCAKLFFDLVSMAVLSADGLFLSPEPLVLLDRERVSPRFRL